MSSSPTEPPISRRRFAANHLVTLLVAAIGLAGTLGAAWIAGKSDELKSAKTDTPATPPSFSQTVSQGFQILVQIASGPPQKATAQIEMAPPAAGSAAHPGSPPPTSPAQAGKLPQVATTLTPAAPKLDAFPKYADHYILAYGMTSSVHNKGQSTVVPVRIENKLPADVLIAYDSEGTTTITSDTGETNGNAGGCNVGGIRGIHVSNLTKPFDPLQFSGVAAGASLTLQVGCFLATADETKVNFVNVNIPLVRLDQDGPKRFTLNLDGIPVRH
jgi:hypothetical protein